jgi:hypothetical protein
MSMDNNSAFEQFFIDGNLSNFTDPDRNWFTENPNAPDRQRYDYQPGSSRVEDNSSATRNYDGSIRTYSNEIDKMQEFVDAQYEQSGGLEIGTRAELLATQAGHGIQDLFSGIF